MELKTYLDFRLLRVSSKEPFAAKGILTKTYTHIHTHAHTHTHTRTHAHVFNTEDEQAKY